MKLNRKWLHEEFVDLSHVSDKEYVEKLTVFGQKVETWERMDAEIKNVKVGKVVSIVRHENSDHMWVCQVDVGEEEPVQIVTGAQNVNEGDLSGHFRVECLRDGKRLLDLRQRGCI